MKAIIPAAGLGSRFFPLTKSQPKEMLPVVDKPVIQWVVEEAVDAGINDIAIITSPHKRALEDYFSKSPLLEMELSKLGRNDDLEKIQKLENMANIEFIYQEEPKGLGHAILCAEEFIEESPFVVLLGDTICHGKENCTKELINLYQKHSNSVFAVEKVPIDQVSRYGIVEGTKLKNGILEVKDLIEKPEISATPSRLAIIGRYLFVPELLKYQKTTSPGKNNEIQLTDAMRALTKSEKLLAWEYTGIRYDIGSIESWFKSNYELTTNSKLPKSRVYE